MTGYIITMMSIAMVGFLSNLHNLTKKDYSEAKKSKKGIDSITVLVNGGLFVWGLFLLIT